MATHPGSKHDAWTPVGVQQRVCWGIRGVCFPCGSCVADLPSSLNPTSLTAARSGKPASCLPRFTTLTPPIEPAISPGTSVDNAAKDVGQICFRQWPEGGPVPVLPDWRAQLRDEVRPANSTRAQSAAPMLMYVPACRSFLTRAYPIMKKNNPSIPIMLREAQGTLPKVYARYGP